MSNPPPTVLVVHAPVPSGCRCKTILTEAIAAYQVLFAESEAQRVAHCQSQRIDAILLDLATPLGEQIRQLDDVRHWLGNGHPPLVLVGEGDLATAIALLKAGAADYLVKDQLTVEGVRQAVQAAIAKTEPQQQLQYCEEQFQTSIETMLDCFGIFSAERDDAGQILDFRIDYLNESACQNHGMTRDQQVGRGLCELFPSHRDSGLFDKYCHLVETGEPLIKDSLLYEDAFSNQPVSVQVFDIRAAKFKDGFVASWRNVTERRHLEMTLNQTIISLRQERNHLQRLIASAPIGIGIGSTQGDVRIINDAMLALHGLTRAEFEQQGLNWREFEPPEVSEQTERVLAQLRTEGYLAPVEKTLQLRDGRQVPILISLTRSLADPDEHVAFAIDLTQQKQAEVALKASHQRYQELAEAMPQIVWTADAAGQVNYWNSRWYEYTGLDAAASMGLSGADVVHPDDRDRTLNHWSQAITQGHEFEVEHRIQRHDGTYHWFVCRALPTRDQQGQITGWIGTITDIHEHKQLQTQLLTEIDQHQETVQALQVANHKINVILESITDAFIAFDPQWRCIYANGQAAQLLGQSPSELLGQPILTEIFPEDAETPSHQELHRALTEQVAVVYEDFSPHLHLWFEVHAYPSSQGLAVYLQNISDRKRAEQERAHHQETIRHQLAEIEAIYQTAPVGLTILDRDLRFVRLNQRLAEINGKSIEAHLGHTVREVLPDLADQVEPLLQQVLETGEPLLDLELKGETPAQPGEERTWIESWYPLRDANGNIIGLNVVIHEITERKRAEAQLRDSQYLIQQVAETTPGILYVYDLIEQRNVYINRQVTTLLGYTTAQVQAMGADLLPTVIHPEDFARVPDHVAQFQTAQEGQVFELEYRMQQANGEWRWFHTREVLFSRTADGSPRQILGISQDITDRKYTEMALQVTTERFEQAASAVNALIYEWDLLSGRINRTRGLTELVGYTLEAADPTAEWWISLVHPDDRISIEEFWQRLATGDRFQNEYRVRHKAGHYLWIEDHLIVVRNDQGNPVKIVGSSTNITDRKQAELALKEAHIQLEAALAAGSIYTWRWSIPDDRVTTNRHFAYLFGVDPEAVTTGLPISQFLNAIHPDDRPHVVTGIEQAITRRESFAQEYRIRDAYGAERWVIARGRAEYDASGRAIVFPGALTDITDRKQIEAALRDNEARLQGFVDANVVGILYGDIDGNIYRANDEFLRIIGLAQADLEAHHLSWIEITPPEYLSLDQEKIREAQAEGACTPYEKEYLRRDGSRVPVLIGYSLVGNNQTETVVFVVDLSEQKYAEKALRRSEDRLRLAVEAAQLGTWDWHLVTQTVVWNERCKAMFGLPAAADVSIETFWAAIHPDDRDRVQQLMRVALDPNTDGSYQAEFRAIGLHDGVERWISAMGQVYFSTDSRPRRFIGIALDVTERKQAEAKVRDREQRLEIAASAAQLGVFEWDIQQDRARWENPQMYAIFGHTLEDGTLSKAEFIEQVIHPQDREVFERRLQQGMAEGILHHLVCRICHRNTGQWRWIELNGHFTDTSDGIPQRLVGVVGDITDRKQAAENLRLSENRYRTLANAVSQLMWVNDTQGNVQFYNQQWQTYTGVDDLELGVGLWANIIHPDDLPGTSEIRTQAIQQGEAYEIECRLKRFDDVYRWHLARIVPFQDDRGEVLSWFGTATDIHDRKSVEAEREHLLRREQAAREAAERANRIKDEFLAILSHELRSPLNPILGWSKLLQTRKLDATKTAQALSTIERNAKLQTQLIDDLLDVARILRGKLKLENAPVNLAFVIEAAIDTMHTAAEAKFITVRAELQEPVQVWGDAGRLQQILWNLLSNAIKFTPAQGHVEIRLAQHENQAQMTIADTGKGIKAEFLPYIFESFRQEDISITRQHGGLGLGLAIVRYLVEAHGGTITATSEGEGKGATFAVQLPLLTQPLNSVQRPATAPEDVDLTGIRVLAIDDSADARELLTTLLTQYGATVKVAQSGAEGLNQLTIFQPDVIVSDIGMPDLDGFALMRQIRSRPPAKGGQVPAIALTAYTRELDQQRALASGYQQHLSKPLEVERLVQAILSLVKPPSPLSSP